MDHAPAICAQDLAAAVGSALAPIIVDVRRRQAFDAADRMVAGACWRDHGEAAAWGRDLADRPIVVYCVHGHQVSQSAAALLRATGRRAAYLEGGIDAFVAQGGPTLRREAVPARTLCGRGLWLTATDPSIDALACAWLVRRFVDPQGAICCASGDWAEAAAAEIDAVPLGLPAGEGTAAEASMAFEQLLRALDLGLAGLPRMAEIIAGRSQAAAGLESILRGLRSLHGGGEAFIERALPLFDALLADCRRTGEGQ